MPRRGNIRRGADGRGDRGAVQGGVRVSKPRCTRSMVGQISANGNVEAVEPTPGPSVEQSRTSSLMDELKALKVAKALYGKRLAKLSQAQKKRLAELRRKTQVGKFMMPDAPEPKKVKGKAKDREDTQDWGPCPLLPGVPAIPPPPLPQPWDLQRSHNITEEEKDEGTPLDRLVGRMHGRAMLSAGTPPLADPESVMDIADATEDMCPPLIIIPWFSTAESETVPPATNPPRKKIREIQVMPSTGIIQSTVLPQNPLLAEKEILEFTPSSTTSTPAPGSGMSTYELDADVDDADADEEGEGSDVEHEEYLADMTLKPRNVDEYPMDIDSLTDPSLAEALCSIDAKADLNLRTVFDPVSNQDLLCFDWRCEPENFKGVREVFNVSYTGPTFENAELTPLEVFLKIWDADIIAHMVRETNRYANEILRRNEKPNSKIQRWKDVTDVDIKKFFAIIMMQSLVINTVEREYWYPQFDELRIGNFGAIMSYNRFLAIKRCLHFIDNASLPVRPNRLDKILPIIEYLNKKFSSLYVLEQNVAIDESLLLWKGRLSFAQNIATKKARVGIKSYELCESRTGYLWTMMVYSGKGDVLVAQEPAEEDETESATSNIVLALMRPLFNRGHTLVMDNFYNAPLLSRILKVKHKTDTIGTLRLNREFVPKSLREKTKKNMRAGEVAFSSTKDLSVVVWMDKNVVAMISTYHQIKVAGIEKYGYYKYKPQVILDYNLSMGGIDHKDQMLHAYPVERVRNLCWYKKLFRRLLNVSIHNSFVMFNHNRTRVVGNREFRLQLVKELLQTWRTNIPEIPPWPLAPAAPTQLHLPVKNARPLRCKPCHAANVRRTTMWRCSTCDVSLCLDRCFVEYHTRRDD